MIAGYSPRLLKQQMLKTSILISEEYHAPQPLDVAKSRFDEAVSIVISPQSAIDQQHIQLQRTGLEGDLALAKTTICNAIRSSKGFRECPIVNAPPNISSLIGRTLEDYPFNPNQGLYWYTNDQIIEQISSDDFFIPACPQNKNNIDVCYTAILTSPDDIDQPLNIIIRFNIIF